MSTTCPSCQHEYIAGDDRCPACFQSLMQMDLPSVKKSDRIQKLLMNTPVAELLSDTIPVVAKPSDSIHEIIRILRAQKKFCILIYLEGKIQGIISLRDILLKAAGADKDLNKIKAADIMTAKPEVVRPENSIAVLVNKMSIGGFRHIPVLDQAGHPLGILSIQNVLNRLTQ